MERKDITKDEIRAFFTERGLDVDKLFERDNFQRFTKENWIHIKECLEHFSGWKVTNRGIENVDPNLPDTTMLDGKTSSLHEFQSFDEYWEKINKLKNAKERGLLQKMEPIMREEIAKDKLKERVDAYAKEKYGRNLDGVLMQSEPNRSEQMNELFAEFTKARMQGNTLSFIDPQGHEHEIHEDERLSSSNIIDTEHFINHVNTIKNARNLTFNLRSYHVRRGGRISKDDLDSMLKDYNCCERAEDLFDDQQFPKKDRKKELEHIHFYFTEVYQDSEKDLVCPHPNGNEKLSFKLNDESDVSNYFNKIQSVDDLLEVMEAARTHRDTCYKAYEDRNKVKQDRLDTLKNDKEKGDDELER